MMQQDNSGLPGFNDVVGLVEVLQHPGRIFHISCHACLWTFCHTMSIELGPPTRRSASPELAWVVEGPQPLTWNSPTGKEGQCHCLHFSISPASDCPWMPE